MKRLVVAAACLSAMACGSSGTSRSGTAGAGGMAGSGGGATSGGRSGTTGAAGTEGAAGSGACSNGPGFAGGETSIQVASVTAVIVDPTGAPAPNALVQLTGLDLSFTSTTSATGAVNITPGHVLKKPMLRIGDSATWAELAIPITAAAANLGTLTTAAFPSAGSPFSPGNTAVSGGVTLSLAASAVVTIDQLSYATSDQQRFRAVQIPVAKEAALPGIAAHDFFLLYATTPLDTTFCPAATVTVPNDATNPLAPGTLVEFWVHSVDVGQLWAPYGDWARISDGQVSADGTTISTLAGQGFPVLETFAIRAKL